jgi:peptide/nickel transport system substrate-binding protein
MQKIRLRLALPSLALVIAACGTPAATTTTAAPGQETTTTGATGAAGGTVRIGYGGAPADLNPVLGVLVEDFTMYDLVYDTPLTADFEGNFLPALATDWQVSDDGLVWTLTIRDDAVFHDGTPLTAEDVAFSINLYIDNEAFLRSSYLFPFISVEAPDPTTVTLTTEEPIGSFEYRMVAMYVLPQHVWEAVDDVAGFTNDEMIGSGPFRMVEHVQDEFVRLESNPDYWDGAPNVDEVIFQTYSNSDARVQALINGEVDMITEFPATAVNTLRNSSDVVVADGSYFGGRLADIFFNVTEPENCPTEEGGICDGHPALRDVVVRQALAHATDKQQLIDTVLLGLGDIGLGLVPRALGDWYADELEQEDYEFDLDLAAQMLEDAGYIDTDGDGIRECPSDDCGPTGDLTFRLNYPTDNDEHPRVSDTLSGWWQQIGVGTQIQGLDPDTLFSICCPTFNYDVMLWSWTADLDPEGLLSVLLCGEITTGYSETGYCNPTYDDLYDQQAVEIDPAARREIIVEMQRVALEEVPYIIPWYYPRIQAYRSDRFTGWPDNFTIVSLEDPNSLRAITQAG